MHESPPNQDPIARIALALRDAARRAFPETEGKIDPLVTPSRRAELGDFQSNAAMPLGKRLGKNPREVALVLIEHLDAGDLLEPVTEANIAGPGFINLRLRAEALADLLKAMDDETLGLEPPAQTETVVVDLVGVNLAKQMHVGHLRSMIIGDAVARIFERLGHRVIRQNHVGDWGLPIAMVTARLIALRDAGEIDIDALSLGDLDRLYRMAQAECSADRRGLEAVERFDLGPKARAELEEQVRGAEEALARAKQTLVALQSHDPDTVAVWKRISDVTMGECLAICKELGVKVTAQDSAGESSYAEELAPLVEDLLSRNVAEIDEGAAVVRVKGFEQPCLVRKGDGGFLYATTDLAGIRRRVQQLGGDRLIYCVDARQSLHFDLAFAAATRAGYAIKKGVSEPSELRHAAFGMVLGEDHRPFKTRSGENVRLRALVEEAIERAGQIVEGREHQGEPDAEALREIAHAVAVAAIKYADLSNDRVKDYLFSFDRMLAFEGNTGPYLLYAVVRIRNIFRKAKAAGIATDVAGVPFTLQDPSERALALLLPKYAATVRAAGEHLEPHRICAYLFELATTFSTFYDRCRILKESDERVRASWLRLSALTERVLADGLGTLGLPVLDRM